MCAAVGEDQGTCVLPCSGLSRSLDVSVLIVTQVADSMNRRALARGVQLAMGDIKRVNRSGCSDREQPGNGEALLV